MSPPLVLDQPLHASAVAFEGRGLMIIGPSGAGKSGLALSLMALGAVLIGDDRVTLSKSANGITIAAPPRISGKIEARGFGILAAGFTSEVMLSAIADLSTPPSGRLPARQYLRIADADIPQFAVRDLANAPAILLQYLKAGLDHD